jgi:AcrR family transcriptional regulator
MPSASKKELTHDRIVRTAARAIRREGYDRVSVAEVMKEAGLTHGGFYAHFASRDALLAEALDHAAGDANEGLARVAASAAEGQALSVLIEAYLSDRHCAVPEFGCAMAAIGSETRRQSPELRRIATRRFKEMADLLERQMAGWGEPGRHADALALMSCLVGAMVIARAVDEPKLSAEVRAAAGQLAHAQSRSWADAGARPPTRAQADRAAAD